MIFIELTILILIFCVSFANCENGRECYSEYCGSPIGLVGVPIFPYSSTCGVNYLIHDGACPIKSKYCCPAIPGNDGVVLCKGRQYSGGCKSYSMRGRQCVNLDIDDNNAVNSVNTLGNCVRLYDDINCSGKSRALYPGSTQHNDLLQLKFNDVVSSFGRCYDDDYCDEKQSTQCGSGSDELTVGFLSWISQDRSHLPEPVTLFQTGPHERTELMVAQILPQHLNTGTSISQKARNYIQNIGNDGDDAGQILAARLGGSGTDLRNIFPQSPNFKRATWSQVEASVADVVRSSHGGAHFSVNLLYHTTSDTRPYKIIYRIKSSKSDDVVVVNDLLNPE